MISHQSWANLLALREPLLPSAARDLIRLAVAHAKVAFASHAREELAKDGITIDRAIEVLRAGVVEPAEFEHGSWRYRVRAATIYVVVAFRTEDHVVVVTAWRRKR